jgi:hypothetical protein
MRQLMRATSVVAPQHCQWQCGLSPPAPLAVCHCLPVTTHGLSKHALCSNARIAMLQACQPQCAFSTAAPLRGNLRVHSSTLRYAADMLQADQYSMSLYGGMDLGDALCYTSLGAASKFLAVKFFVGECSATCVRA